MKSKQGRIVFRSVIKQSVRLPIIDVNGKLDYED